ncbi:MAG: hypothetical protein KDB60_06620 [Propionibacteriaceae bacterium]|nr:hypothetical protein [Propionibacteriaceae bacterium]
MTNIPNASPRTPAYLAGLLLAGRVVVVVGGGRVAKRRVPKLLQAGALVTIVSPVLHPDLAGFADTGRITWRERVFTASDLDGAWYVIAATDSARVNADVAAEAEVRHTFCVRADRAEAGSAWTPATGIVEDAVVAVLTDHDPRRAKELRDRVVEALGGGPG